MTTNTDNEYQEGSFIDELSDDERWDLYAQRRIGRMKDNFPVIEEFLADIEQCKEVCRLIADGGYTFGTPVRLEVDKPGSKKRVTYTFKKKNSREENIVLGRVNSILQRYDHLFASNLYSYRNTESIVTAMRRLRGIPDLASKFAFKADISNYFNSIPVDRLLGMLSSDIDGDAFRIISGILCNRDVISEGRIIIDNEKGVMAGIPISAFLANYYLKDMDWYFHNKGVLYCRFADDIIVFADTREELEEYKQHILSFVEEMGLSINPDKIYEYSPGEPVTFLGLDLHDGVIDLSKKAMVRAKKKIRSTADMYRMSVEKGEFTAQEAMIETIASLNNRFFGSDESDVSWCRWYFPLLTTDKSLKVLDGYAQQCIRYVATGRFSEKNHRIVPYRTLSDYGYIPLVSAYYGGAYRA